MSADTGTTNIGTGTPGSQVAGAAAGAGLTVDDSMADVSSMGGPLLVGEIVDGTGELVGVVGVLDDGDGADALLAAMVPAAAAELGGVGRPGSPVGSGAEVAARFSMPVRTTTFRGGNGPRAVLVAVLDRRDQADGPVPATAGQPGPAPSSSPMAPQGDHSGHSGLDKLVNVSLEVSVELGRTRVTLAHVLDYDVGSTIELDRAAGAPVDIRVNDTLLARGEVVLIDDEYAVRVTEILDPNQQP